MFRSHLSNIKNDKLKIPSLTWTWVTLVFVLNLMFKQFYSVTSDFSIAWFHLLKPHFQSNHTSVLHLTKIFHWTRAKLASWNVNLADLLSRLYHGKGRMGKRSVKKWLKQEMEPWRFPIWVSKIKIFIFAEHQTLLESSPTKYLCESVEVQNSLSSHKIKLSKLVKRSNSNGECPMV